MAAAAAADRADREAAGWASEALEHLRRYAEGVGRPFLVEEASRSFRPAPDGRAWGAVAQAAARDGWLTAAGFGKAHDGSPKTLWQWAARRLAHIDGRSKKGRT